jgi:Phosphotransferase enzyme family
MELQRSSDIYGIVIDPQSGHVLLMPGEGPTWTLPHVHVPDKRIWLANAGIVSVAMQKLLQAEVTVLRCVYSEALADGTHVDLIHVLENHGEDWIPPVQARWFSRGELEALPLACSEHGKVIDDALREVDSETVPALRPLWARPRWFKDASDWMDAQLAEKGYTLTTPITQLKNWGISCLLRAGTDRGTVFFKVSTALPLFGNEPALLQALAERYPDAVPPPIAVDASRRWMLLEDFGPELRSSATLQAWEFAAQRFGQLQLETAAHIDELLAIGCLDRRLEVLADQIDPLLGDEAALATMSAGEITQLRSLAPRLKEMCRDLAGYRVPYTLNHGDLHGGNITARTLRFFDWTDACIAHPFLDLPTVLADVDDLKDSLNARAHVLQVYLNLWTDHEPMERLREMWRLAEPLGALHQAVSYQHILAILEPDSKREMIWGVPEWLRRVLKAMEAQ